jgi:uncharacterized Zn-finger protein
LLGKIDSIVHGDLYNFGLQFSYAWAGPYWAFVRLVYLCLLVPSVLSGVALVFSFLNKSEEHVKLIPKVVENKPIVGKVQPPQPQPQPQAQPQTQTAKESQNHMVVSCPSCKRVFGKPLVMLDFSSGKTRLVNVCPYCNHILGSAEEQKDSDVDIRVVDLNKKEAKQK